MAVDLVPDLIKAGVRSFKIEGRLKGPEYVAITTKAYRKAVDEAWELITQERNTKTDFIGINEDLRHDLRQVFARGQDEKYDGLSRGFLEGPRHQSIVRGRSPRHRGNMVGRVVSLSKRGIEVDVMSPVKRGDGVVFDRYILFNILIPMYLYIFKDKMPIHKYINIHIYSLITLILMLIYVHILIRNEPEENEEGGSIYEIFDPFGNSVGIDSETEICKGIHTLTFAKGALNLNRIRKGNIIWRNKDPALDSRIQKDYLNKGDKQMIPIGVKVTGKIGEKLMIMVTDSEGRRGVGT